MSKHKHQLPEELENNPTWLAWIEIKDITRKSNINNKPEQVEIEILLRDAETGVISPSDQKFLVIGDTITIAPWKPREPAPRALPKPYYYWIQSKSSQKRYIAKFQYTYDKEAYMVHAPAHPTKAQWIANKTFYSGFFILDKPGTLEEYERANDEHTI